MTRAPAIACIDIGKTNRRVVLLSRATGAEIAHAHDPNAPILTGPYPALDLDGTLAFIESALTRFARIAEIDTIAISTHGAAFVALAGDRPALPALDYEHPGPDALTDYPRPPYAETFSPALPGGLNAGRGLAWLARGYPDAFAKTDTILALNQYIAFHLSGIRASDCTALGCHTDLWNTDAQSLSSLTQTLGWTRLFPPLHTPGQILGPLRAEIATRTGLPATCAVLCGIHDSNATLVPYLTPGTPRATVFSTGTWIIGFSLGGATHALDETRDCLANSDYLGRPIPSARMMGGRELALLTGGATDTTTLPDRFTADDIPRPGFVPGTGPFGQNPGHLPATWPDRPAPERAALASLYCAFTTAVMAGLIDSSGPMIVEGVFARNPIFLDALAQTTGAPVQASPDSTGTIAGLATLAGLPQSPKLTPISPTTPGLDRIFRDWLSRI